MWNYVRQYGHDRVNLTQARGQYCWGDIGFWVEMTGEPKDTHHALKESKIITSSYG